MGHAVDASPRASKRRRLNYTDHIEPASSPVAAEAPPKTSNSILKRPTRRTALSSSINGINGDAGYHTQRPQQKTISDQAAPSVTNGTPTKKVGGQITEAELYDDIEGAHDVTIPSRGRETITQSSTSKSNRTPTNVKSPHWQREAKNGEEPGGLLVINSARRLSRSPESVNESAGLLVTRATPSTRSNRRTRTRSSQTPTGPRLEASKINMGALLDIVHDHTKTRKGAPGEEREEAPYSTLSPQRSTGKQPFRGSMQEIAYSNRPKKRRKLVTDANIDHLGRTGYSMHDNKVPPPPKLDSTEPRPGSPSGLLRGEAPRATTDASPETSQNPECSHILLKKILTQKLTGKRPIPLTGLEEAYSKVHQLLEQTVVAGEGNSMLILGARGSGKSALVSRVLSELSRDQEEHYHVIKLNGFIHTDDKLAIREIWRQLGRELDVEDEAFSKNYADTLSTLLALLSLPAELDDTKTDHVAKSVIFIIDEFDLFTTHTRQTLLYNLFDTAQSRKAPVAVLGLTARVDIAESLEKRVKSRFSHRYVHVSLPRRFVLFQEICKAVLQVKDGELGFEERTALKRAVNAPMQKGGSTASPGVDLDFLDAWNASVEDLFTEPSFTQHLATLYYRSKSIPAFLSSALLPVACLQCSSTSHLAPLTASSFTFDQLAAPDSNLHILPSLSDLELSFLIAAARLDVILDTDTCNFEMVFDEYVSLASKARFQHSSSSLAGFSAGSGGGGGVKIWGRDVAMAAWERLAAYELILPVGFGSAGSVMVSGGSGSERQGKMWRVDVGLEEIPPAVGPGLSSVMGRWCREI